MDTNTAAAGAHAEDNPGRLVHRSMVIAPFKNGAIANIPATETNVVARTNDTNPTIHRSSR